MNRRLRSSITVTACNVMLMLRLLFRVCDELPDAVGPVVSSGSRSRTKNASKLTRLPPPYEQQCEKTSFRSKYKSSSHFDETLRLTLSLTCSIVFGFASLLPPPKPTERPTVPRRVPMARYSVLMARPRITLHSNKPVNKWPRVGEGAGKQTRTWL